MKTATAVAYIDRWHPKTDSENPSQKTCAVSIRVTSNRVRRYYPTGIVLSVKAFDRIMTATRRTQEEKAIYNKIHDFVAKANSAIEKVPVFTFENFEKLFVRNRNASERVFDAFTEYIDELMTEGRVGTAGSYKSAQISLKKFKTDLRFADITSSMLTSYQNWMTGAGNSLTTVGFYIRALRVIYNRSEIDKSLYPFGNGRNGKYKVPAGRNIKKALSHTEIEKIFLYQPKGGSNAELARDYWVFSYLCNGINIKDLCLLQKKNIDGNTMTFVRSKTKRSYNDGRKIIVSLKKETLAVIKKWGQQSLDPENYVFPHITKSMSPLEVRKAVQNLTQLINKNMKRIASELLITKPVTTYSARHSFATVLKRAGKSPELISECLGHSNVNTTESYLDSFEPETLHNATDVLTAFPKAV